MLPVYGPRSPGLEMSVALAAFPSLASSISGLAHPPCPSFPPLQPHLSRLLFCAVTFLVSSSLPHLRLLEVFPRVPSVRFF